MLSKYSRVFYGTADCVQVNNFLPSSQHTTAPPLCCLGLGRFYLLTILHGRFFHFREKIFWWNILCEQLFLFCCLVALWLGLGSRLYFLLLQRARVVAILCRARYSQSRVAGHRVGEEDSGMRIYVCEVLYQIVAPWQGLTMSVSYIRTPVFPHPDSCTRKSCIFCPRVTKSCKLCGAESARCGRGLETRAAAVRL